MKQWISKLLSKFESSTEDSRSIEEIAKSISEERATLLHIVDVYNRHLFEVDKWPIRKVREILDEFARQLIHASPPQNEKLLFRLRQFFSTYRIDEASYVQKTFDDFKGIIWDFADQLSEDIRFEHDRDLEVQQSLTQLREAVESESISDLRTKSREFIDFYVSYQTLKDQRRSERLQSIQNNLSQMHKKLSDANDDMRRDHLTGALNRKAFDEKLEQLQKLHQEKNKLTCLLLVDIDHFKKVNDTYGHDVGDFVLKELVKMLKELEPKDKKIVARIGGEEFAVILQNTHIKEAQRFAEKCLERIRRERIIHGKHQFHFTISIGLSQIMKEESISDWLKRTDIALYESKHNGRNRFSLAYDPTHFNSAA